MTIQEFMQLHNVARLELEYYGSGDDGGFECAVFYGADGKELELEEEVVEWMNNCAINADGGCLDIEVNNEGGGAEVNIQFDGENLTCEGYTYYNEEDSKQEGDYEGRLDPDILTKINGGKNHFSDCEVAYRYYGGGDSFEDIDQVEGPKVDLDERALLDAFNGEYPSFNNEGGHGAIALNLFNGDYKHEAYYYEIDEVKTELTTDQIHWFQTYDA